MPVCVMLRRCGVFHTHTPRAGELVAILAETAHAVTTVTSGMRVALNSWLNCHPAKQVHRTQPRPTACPTNAAITAATAASVPASRTPVVSALDAGAAAATCPAPLVFYVGLQKAGTSSFMKLMGTLGYRAWKLAWNGPMYEHSALASTCCGLTRCDARRASYLLAMRARALITRTAARTMCRCTRCYRRAAPRRSPPVVRL